jgi:hypothetical protein
MSRGYQPEDHLEARVSPADREPGLNDPPKPDKVREPAPDGASQFPAHRHDRVASRSREPRTIYELRGRTHRLRSSEIRTMVEIGKFRTAARRDLAEFLYDGNSDRMRPDVENLYRQGLIELKTIPDELMGSRQLLALTKNGHRFLTETESAGKGQALYHGFSKRREAHHDADLYRLYQRAAARIEDQGGRNLRVVLDYELKKRLYQGLAKLGEDRGSPDEQRAVAGQHGLRVVDGKIPVPDVRIEYETRDDERAREDLELVTRHYRLEHLVEKALAGFSIYAHAEEASNLRRVLQQRRLTAEILTL